MWALRRALLLKAATHIEQHNFVVFLYIGEGEGGRGRGQRRGYQA
jgi:hypothetical protein